MAYGGVYLRVPVSGKSLSRAYFPGLYGNSPSPSIPGTGFAQQAPGAGREQLAEQGLLLRPAMDSGLFSLLSPLVLCPLPEPLLRFAINHFSDP